MAYPVWNFVLTDFAGKQIGEVLDAPERTHTRALSGPSTAGFKILATNRLLGDVLSRDQLNLMVYRNRTLQFHGPLIAAQFVADDLTNTPAVVVTAADPSWRFDRRVAGKSATGTLFSGTDRLTVAESLIGTANSESETGVQTLGQTCGSTAFYTAGPYKKLSECIADMGNTLSGFDWYIEPKDYAAGKIGLFRAAAVLGLSRAQAVFEYQGRGNMRAPDYQRGIESSVNKVYSIPDDGPASPLGIVTAQDVVEQGVRGLLEEVVDTSSISNVALRQAVCDDHILYRKKPRQVLSFQPDISDGSGRVPEWGRDYFIGDTVRARVLYNQATLVEGFVRIYKMQFDIDENNRETLTPTVVNEA